MNLTNYLNIDQLKEFAPQVKNVFFYRVCGTGMAAAACLVKEAGFNVVGADSNFYPPMSDYLYSTNIEIINLSKVDQAYLQKFDLIVVGNVVRKDGPDAQMIEASGVKFCSFPALLGALVLDKRRVVGIAGTHGKTTTTYLFSQVFEKLGFDVGHFVGGVMEDRAPASLGKDSYFFIESDEYDSAYFEKYSKFLSYEIDDLVWTSLEFDHGDIYKNIDEILVQFKALLNRLPGSCIYNSNYQIITNLLHEYYPKMNAIKYGVGPGHNIQIVSENGNGTLFKMNASGREISFETNLVGLHNILNLGSVISFAMLERVPVEEISRAVRNLKMVKRRQEVKGAYNKAIIIDDFAHHPTAVEVTLEAIKTRFAKIPVHVVFEPASATARSNIFESDFAHALAHAHHVHLMPPPTSTTVKDRDTINLNNVKNIIDKKAVQCDIVEKSDDLISMIKDQSTSPNVWVIMSNGKCQGFWESEFVKKLSSVSI